MTGQNIRATAKLMIPIVLVLGLIQSIALAQSGTFAATGNMTTPRSAHTAALLPNGKVLIAGGYQQTLPNSILSSAELYDPSTGTFTATDKMSIPRAGHTATLLADGRVLISGGSGDLSAEIYDPASGAFTATGDMVALPYSWLRSTTLLQDGRVFIAAQPTAEVYDPVSGTFATVGPYAAPAPTYMETATLLPDGRVLISGGNDAAGWTELYDPTTGMFSLAGNENYWSDVNTATLLMSGKVLFVGTDDSPFPANAEVFDPAAGTFIPIGNAATAHEYAAVALLPDGTVLITGGELAGGNGELVSELYLPENATFSAAGNMITARHEHTATLLADGTVLIAGGYNLWPSPTSSAELYSPAALVPAPVLFSADWTSQGAIWHAATGVLATSDMPATVGEALSMYTTSLFEGGAIPPQVAIGGRLAEILYFGDAPGYPGYNQVNFRVPSGVAQGPAVPVHLTYLGRPSNTVMIGFQ
jgi:Kelch motif